MHAYQTCSFRYCSMYSVNKYNQTVHIDIAYCECIMCIQEQYGLSLVVSVYLKFDIS